MLLIGVWLLLLDGIFVVPWWQNSATPGDELVRNTVRLSLLYYAVATLLMLWLRPAEWDASSERGGLARWAWSLALVAYVVHVLLAIKYAHHWSHADAIRHTQERSGFGAGIYVSHFFTVVWTLDVGWWWLRPTDYARRSPWFGWVLHAFMAFIVFCGMVVYETGFIRWAGVVMFVFLGGALAYRVFGERRASGVATQTE
jgi:Ca2+/Na+ antiporter